MLLVFVHTPGSWRDHFWSQHNCFSQARISVSNCQFLSKPYGSTFFRKIKKIKKGEEDAHDNYTTCAQPPIILFSVLKFYSESDDSSSSLSEDELDSMYLVGTTRARFLPTGTTIIFGADTGGGVTRELSIFIIDSSTRRCTSASIILSIFSLRAIFDRNRFSSRSSARSSGVIAASRAASFSLYSARACRALSDIAVFVGNGFVSSSIDILVVLFYV